MSMTSLRVFIAADDPLARAGLDGLVRAHPDLVIAGEDAMVGLPNNALRAADPDVIVADLGSGPRESDQTLDVVGVAGYPAVVLATPDVDASEVLGHGIRGIVLREIDADTLAAALRGAASGLVVLDPAFAAALAPAALAPGALAPGDRDAFTLVEDLTPREHQVLQQLAEGLSNKAIAGRLGLSEHTVKYHVDAILGKLGAHSRTEAVTRAARLGLLLL